jgi:hypothetical protein
VFWTSRLGAVSFVVVQWAVVVPITQKARAQTRFGVTTAIHTRTVVVLTPLLVLFARAVIDAVTACEVWQAVTIVWALEVIVRARYVN